MVFHTHTHAGSQVSARACSMKDVDLSPPVTSRMPVLWCRHSSLRGGIHTLITSQEEGSGVVLHSPMLPSFSPLRDKECRHHKQLSSELLDTVINDRQPLDDYVTVVVGVTAIVR